MLHYTYTASGQKISQQLVSNGRLGTRRDYAGSFVYVNNHLAWINTPHGRIINKESTAGGFNLVKEYHLRDHLGNTRLVLEETGSDTYTPTHIADYYPFGMEIQRGPHQIAPPPGNVLNNRYLYNGKEYQDDFGLNWYDYGARFYDAQIGRFHTLDPLSEKYSFQSPFAYAANNPILFIDFMGLGPGIPGPFTGQVYRNKSGQAWVKRYTTSERRVLNATKQVFYTAVDKVTLGVGGTLLSMGESTYSYFQNPSSEASREAGLSSAGLLASSSGNISTAIANEVPEATRSIFSNSGKRLKGAGTGFSLLSVFMH